MSGVPRDSLREPEGRGHRGAGGLYRVHGGEGKHHSGEELPVLHRGRGGRLCQLLLQTHVVHGLHGEMVSNLLLNGQLDVF